MLQLAYMSVAADHVAASMSAAISYQAEQKNNADEITGVLLGDGPRLLQVLEGPKEAVENTFLRIMTDSRHHSVLLLSRRLVTVREFGPWDMANCETEAERAAVVDRVRHLIVGSADHIREAFQGAYPETFKRSRTT